MNKKLKIMETKIFKNNWLTTAGLLLALPTGYFIIANILNEWGVPGLYNGIAPFIARTGGDESLGWNINLLILFGPVLAILLTVFQVVQIRAGFTKEDFQLNLSVRKRWFPLLVGAFAASLLAILFLYSLVENCNCK
jgi:hypothetical protein